MRKKNVNRPGVNAVDTVLVPCKPPKGLLTNLCVCAVDASVVVRVAVVRAILVKTFMVSPMESVHKYKLPHSVPKRSRSVVHVFAQVGKLSQMTPIGISPCE